MEINPMRDVYIGELNVTNPRREFHQLTAYHLDNPKNVIFDLVHDLGPWNPTMYKTTPTVVFEGLDGQGIKGWYDTMPDKTPAYEIDGNRVRVKLIPHMTQKVGHVAVFVKFMGDDLSYTSIPLCMLHVVEGAHGYDCEVKPVPIITVRPMTPEELEDPETKAWWEGIKAQDNWTGPEITVELVGVSGPGMKLEGDDNAD